MVRAEPIMACRVSGGGAYGAAITVTGELSQSVAGASVAQERELGQPNDTLGPAAFPALLQAITAHATNYQPLLLLQYKRSG